MSDEPSTSSPAIPPIPPIPFLPGIPPISPAGGAQSTNSFEKYFVKYLPITKSNDLRLYIDGKDYCADLYTDLKNAHEFVFLTGLHFMADFRLTRQGNDTSTTLSKVLAETAKRQVEVFLLVNQFWEDESEISKIPDSKVEAIKRAYEDLMSNDRILRRKIMKEGELEGYLPETYRLFSELEGYGYINCRTDIHPNSDTVPFFGTHHQKTIVIDDKVAYVGGIDLTYLDGDRWDTPEHKIDNRHYARTQKYWHDIHMRIEGPAVFFVTQNFVERWKNGRLYTLKRKGDLIKPIRDKNPPPLPYKFFKPAKMYSPGGTVKLDESTVQVVRSMPTRFNWPNTKPIWNFDQSGERWEHSCKDAYLIGIRAASNYIYLENQWIVDRDIWIELRAAARRNQTKDFRIVLMLPYTPLSAARLGSNSLSLSRVQEEIEKIIKESNNSSTFGMYSLMKKHAVGTSGDQIYVHSKILIVDDEWALIGSANAGGTSLHGAKLASDYPDTELSAITLDKKFASNFRKKLWEEHLGSQVDVQFKASDADQFRKLAAQKPPDRVRFFPIYQKVLKR
ncbi:MAG: phospholipase D-like domain-containing protein [Methanosarcina sp.]